MAKNIGWIGTGIMGKSMCGHLIKAGHKVAVYNRTAAKARELVDSGAIECRSPAEVAGTSDYLFTIVGFPSDVEEVYLGERGVLAALKKGAIVIDMTTSQPSLAKKIAVLASERGIATLDAPVSGGDLGAREGTLAIMVGGPQAAFDEILPLFQLMGRNIKLMGGAGAGQHTKMANQTLIASTMIGVVESLLYARRAGLDLDMVIDVIGQGAASSWSLNNLGRRIAAGNFDPGFFIKHFVKDMGIALDEAVRMQLSLPGLSMVREFYIAAMAQGLENLGTQALYKVIDRMNSRS